MTLKELEVGKSAVIRRVGGDCANIFWIWA